MYRRVNIVWCTHCTLSIKTVPVNTVQYNIRLAVPLHTVHYI